MQVPRQCEDTRGPTLHRNAAQAHGALTFPRTCPFMQHGDGIVRSCCMSTSHACLIHNLCVAWQKREWVVVILRRECTKNRGARLKRHPFPSEKSIADSLSDF
jgi:hypothetical protein